MGFSYYNTDDDTRRAIFIAILIILVILLLGLTIFFGILLLNDNSDGTIGVNVTTGNCKVDIVDTDGDSLVGDVLDFVADEGVETIYFEPGMICHTEAFMVKNLGTSAFNFHVSITGGIEIESEEFQNAFDVWVSTDPTSIDEAERLTEFTGKLLKGETSEPCYLVISMKDTATNELQDKTFTGIGITVHAVQTNS